MKFAFHFANYIFPSVCAAVLACTISSAAAPADGILVDKVWSGHPVGFALLTERGHQFVAYYDAERRLTIVGRKLADETWTRIQPEGVPAPGRDRDSNVTGWDSHNSLKLALDRDGCLHLSGNMHVDPLVYYRTREPFDLGTLERIDRMTGEREKKVTYPVFLRNAAGDMVFRYRDGGSGNGSDLYKIYDPATRTWRRLLDTPLLESEGERNAYAQAPFLGPDHRFHMLWMWRETPDALSNNTLSYARSPDLIHWETSTGKPLTLPITRATGETVDPAKPGGGLINMCYSLGFDSHQRPVAVYHRFDKDGRSQAFAARPDADGKWRIRQLSQWKFCWDFAGGGSQAKQVSLSAPAPDGQGNLLVDFSTAVAGSGRWRIDEISLETRETLPRPKPAFKLPPLRPDPDFPGLQVRTTGGGGWLLRWQTLGPNRDRANRAAPPPSELRLFHTGPR